MILFGLDVTSLVIGLAIGAAVVGVGLYLGAVRRRGVVLQPKPVEFELSASPMTKLVSKAEIEAAKRELRLLKMDKEYLSTALARIYEAEARGLINKEERVTLSQKYKIQLKEVEDKIAKAQMMVDVSDLEDARSELLSLVNQKITQIDSRLNELKQKISPMIPQPEFSEPPEPVTKEKKERTEEQPRKPEIMDDRLKKVVQDVNEVMAKLEQMDLEE
jgi:hypothetical protein